jgi:hypothetical protein
MYQLAKDPPTPSAVERRRQHLSRFEIDRRGVHLVERRWPHFASTALPLE